MRKADNASTWCNHPARKLTRVQWAEIRPHLPKPTSHLKCEIGTALFSYAVKSESKPPAFSTHIKPLLERLATALATTKDILGEGDVRSAIVQSANDKRTARSNHVDRLIGAEQAVEGATKALERLLELVQIARKRGDLRHKRAPLRIAAKDAQTELITRLIHIWRGTVKGPATNWASETGAQASRFTMFVNACLRMAGVEQQLTATKTAIGRCIKAINQDEGNSPKTADRTHGRVKRGACR